MQQLDPIELLLSGTYPDPETGELLKAEARSVVIADSLAGREVELVTSLGIGGKVAVVADKNTRAALGDRIERALSGELEVVSVELHSADGGPVHATQAHVDGLIASLATSGAEAVIAVGSGTINDLCKMAALHRDIPQLVFATAPSMNGYTSVSASIIVDGVKRSFRARTPVGAFFDLAVIAAAPLPLIRAGLGDSIARSTAQADWLLSHLLLGRPYREAPFALLTADEQVLFADPSALITGDLAAVRALVRTLVLSGFGMTLCNGSFPASQGEHLLGHYLEMIRPLDVLHGAQIGVCTLAMAQLQARILSDPVPPRVRPSPRSEADFTADYGAAGPACWLEYTPKRVDTQRAADLNATLVARWDTMRLAIERVTVPPDRLRSILLAAGCPTTPAELGYTDDDMRRALAHAREIRDRYTFLDLAADLAI
jgi:glycerol-1-phosphate dehydrogenase [NAD(P)+]